MNCYVLYTIPASLYSGKARSYMRKRHIDYVERSVGDPRFGQHVLPQLGRFIMPVLQTPDGALIQDTVDIIDHFEQTAPAELSAYPAGPKQRVVAHLLEMFGGEGQDPQDELRTIFGESRLEALLDARPRRRMIRRENREAWGAPQGPVLAR